MSKIVRLLLLIACPLVLYIAYDFYTSVEAAQNQRQQLLGQINTINRDISDLQGSPIKPLSKNLAALEDLMSQLIDDTELLGSSVRLNVPETGLVWQPVRYGIQKTVLSVSSASEAQAALGFFYILWQLLESSPVSVVGGRIDIQGDVISFEVQLELFGIQG